VLLRSHNYLCRVVASQNKIK